MKAIAIKRGAKTMYFSTEEKALNYLREISYDSKVYNRMNDEINELHIKDFGDTSYWVTANNNTIWDTLGMFSEDNSDYYEYEVRYININ